MIGEALGSRRVRTGMALLGGTLALAATGCGGSQYPNFNSNDPDALIKMYQKKEVDQCTGTAVLAYDGNVRPEPFVTDVVDGGDSYNVIPQYDNAAATNAVTLTDPQLININTPGGSPSWFIERIPSGQDVFINYVAIAQDNTKCGPITSPNTGPGVLEIRQMRNFNQPVAVALASMASFLGGNALAPSAAAADQDVTTSPQLFQECAYQATADPNYAIVSENDSVNQQGNSAHHPIATFDLQDQQYGDIGDGTGSNSDETCNGSLTVKDSIQLKVGSFTTTVPNASTELTVDNDSMQEYDAPEATASGSFSYSKECNIARQLGEFTRPVMANVIETEMYTDTGYASVTTSSTVESSPLFCIKLATGVLVPAGSGRA